MYQCLMAVLVEIKSIPYFWLVRAYNNIVLPEKNQLQLISFYQLVLLLPGFASRFVLC